MASPTGAPQLTRSYHKKTLGRVADELRPAPIPIFPDIKIALDDVFALYRNKGFRSLATMRIAVMRLPHLPTGKPVRIEYCPHS